MDRHSPLFFGEKKKKTQEELTPCDQCARRECSFLTLFCWISLVEGGFEKCFFKIVSVRACVHPEAHSSRIGRFCLTKSYGFYEIPLWSRFMSSNQSILFRKKGLEQKNRYLLSTYFFCEIHNSHISCCVTPTGAHKNKNVFASFPIYF